MHVSKSKSIDWFRNAKYGMFIHFGAYSTTGGIWNGKKMEDWKRSRHVEWLMLSAKISRSEYGNLLEYPNKASLWGKLTLSSKDNFLIKTD